MTLLANFDRRQIPQAPVPSSYRPNSVIPESDHSDRQKAIDEGMVAALAVGRLIQRSPHTGEANVADRYWAPSRTQVESTPVEDGPDTYEIIGGWVTKDQAILELTSANEPDPATVTNLATRRAA